MLASSIIIIYSLIPFGHIKKPVFLMKFLKSNEVVNMVFIA